MANLVIQNSEGSDVTTSLIVAEVFGKEHNKVVRDIESLSCSKEFQSANFGVSLRIRDLPNGGHKEERYYEMTKDGFSFLVMGYTGAKAGEFKERFINEFNRREALLKDEDYILMRSQQILQKRLEASEERVKELEAQAEKQSKQIEKLQPKADFAEAAFKAEGKVDIGQAAKILGLPFGRNTLFKKLKEAGVFFANRNEPKQKYIDAGYFEMTLLPPIHRDNHPDIMYMKVICCPKGLALINIMFGGTPPQNKLAQIQ